MKLQVLLEDWIALGNVNLVPPQIKALYCALELLAEAPVEQRTITNLITQVQHGAVRDGLSPFSLSGPLGRFLDADRDVLPEGDLVTFELETLMGMGPKVTIPVLTYLFHRIEQRLDGRPTLIVIDEAWVVLANSTFSAKLEEWLRTLRKKNAAVVLATQSLSEIANSSHRDVILESCPTKLYLPNGEAKNPQTRELYRRFGLSDRQIDIIAEAAPKRDWGTGVLLGQAKRSGLKANDLISRTVPRSICQAGGEAVGEGFWRTVVQLQDAGAKMDLRLDARFLISHWAIGSSCRCSKPQFLR